MKYVAFIALDAQEVFVMNQKAFTKAKKGNQDLALGASSFACIKAAKEYAHRLSLMTAIYFITIYDEEQL